MINLFKSIIIFLAFSTILIQSFIVYAAHSDAGLLEVSVGTESPLTTLLDNTSAIRKCKCSYDKKFTFIGKKSRETLDLVSEEL